MASPDLLAAAKRLLASGAWDQAEVAANAAVAAAPDSPAASLLLGLAIAAMGEADRAAPILTRAAVACPDAEHPCLALARLTPPLPRTLVARQFRACLRQGAADHRLVRKFAEFLLDTGHAAEAEEVLRDGPATAASHHLMGLARAEQAKFSAAGDSFQSAVTLDPDAAGSWSNLGMMLKIEGHFARAVAAHDRAVTLAPADPRFRVNRGVGLLKAGLWQRAWRDYEARFQLPGALAVDPTRLMPSLRPSDDLTGVTVLALHEEGFGDTLQFARYIPLLAARGARVVACVPASLARLMRTMPGVAELVTGQRDLPSHDFVCPMFSFPRVFGTTVETVPPVPPIPIDPALVHHWAEQLPDHGLRVGLVWAGQARPLLTGFATLDRRRSAGLAAFQPLFDVAGVSFVSLQAGPAARQPRPRGLEMVDLMTEVTDFADTAAIIAGLDVVVSVDTSVVHLAGLLGKPVFLLDRYDGCWRWLSDRSDSPWYPGVRIFRQRQPDDWTTPMTEAAAALRTMVLFRGLGSGVSGIAERASVA